MCHNVCIYFCIQIMYYYAIIMIHTYMHTYIHILKTCAVIHFQIQCQLRATTYSSTVWAENILHVFALTIQVDFQPDHSVVAYTCHMMYSFVYTSSCGRLLSGCKYFYFVCICIYR